MEMNGHESGQIKGDVISTPDSYSLLGTNMFEIFTSLVSCTMPFLKPIESKAVDPRLRGEDRRGDELHHSFRTWGHPDMRAR